MKNRPHPPMPADNQAGDNETKDPQAEAAQTGDPSTVQFHRLALAHPRHAGDSTKKLRPLLGMIVGVALAVPTFLLILLLGSGLGAVIKGVDVTDQINWLDDPRDPIANGTLLFSFAAIIPLIFLAARIAGYRCRFLFSSAGRMRWDVFIIAAVTTIGVGIFAQVLGFALGPGVEFRDPTGKELWLIPIVLVLVPFQAFSEELFARGFVPQLFGIWFKSPWLAYLPGALLWIYLHDYNIWGIVIIAYSALTYGILVHKTGGLEASTAVHTVGNYVAFLQPIFFVFGDSDGNSSTWESAIFDIITTSITVGLVYILVRRFSLHHGAQDPNFSYSGKA